MSSSRKRFVLGICSFITVKLIILFLYILFQKLKCMKCFFKGAGSTSNVWAINVVPYIHSKDVIFLIYCNCSTRHYWLFVVCVFLSIWHFPTWPVSVFLYCTLLNHFKGIYVLLNFSLAANLWYFGLITADCCFFKCC
jgi:hypothetical protein